jgi:hypothetical protein
MYVILLSSRSAPIATVVDREEGIEERVKGCAGG